MNRGNYRRVLRCAAFLGSLVAALPPKADAQASKAQQDGAIASNALRLRTAFYDKDGALHWVGNSGQIFSPTKDPSTQRRSWKRNKPGGVSTEVYGLVSSPNGQFFAVGDRAPIFRSSVSGWSAFPLVNRGDIKIAKGRPKHAAISIGRSLYTLQGTDWKRLGGGPKNSVTLLGTKKLFYSLDDKGTLSQSRGPAFRKMTVRLPKNDKALAIALGPNGRLAIGGSSGSWYWQATRPAPMPISEELRKMSLRLLAIVPLAELLVDGTKAPLLLFCPKTEGAEASTPEPKAPCELARLTKKGLEIQGPAPTLGPGDRFEVLVDDAKGPVLASWYGRVFQLVDSGNWQELEVSNQLPTKPAGHPLARPAQSP